MADTTAPVLIGLTIPGSIDVSSGRAAETITAIATDTGSGVTQLVVNLDARLTYGFSSTDAGGTWNFFLNSGFPDSWADGQSSASYWLSPSNSNGNYHVTSVVLTDAAGNSSTYTPAQLQPMGINTTIAVTGGTSPSGSVDTLAGGPGNDRLQVPSGNCAVDGGSGTDTAVIGTSVTGVLSYSIGAGGVQLATALGTDALANVERVQFSDALFALDTNPGGHVWQAAALFHAAFGLLPGRADLSHWTARADQSSGMGELAQHMIEAYAPGVSSHDLVAFLYQQLVHQVATADVVQGYVDQVGTGKTFATQGDLVASAANLPLNTDGVASMVGTVQQLDPGAF